MADVDLRSAMETPFPFGALSIQTLEAFEGEVGWSLPSEFREYLLLYNGAEFVKDVYSLSEDGWNSVRIHHVHGLHNGPDYFRLQENWQLYENYDLQRWKRKLAHFVVFADTSTGDQFAINVKDGSIWLYEHDAESRFLRMPGRFSKIENNFTSFVATLETQDENFARLEGDPRYEDFKVRLAEATAYRESEVQKWKDSQDT